MLWSTSINETFDNKELKHVPIENVTSEVLKFYDFYSWYYDGTGFSKDALIKSSSPSTGVVSSIMSAQKDLKKLLFSLNVPTVFAVKGNDGKGSYVVVFYVNEHNIDIIAFSNNLLGQGSQSTTSNIGKFRRWFNGLLGTETSDRGDDALYSDRGLGVGDDALYIGRRTTFGDTSLSLENRRFVVSPKIDDNGKLSGKIAVEVRVDRDGKVISARAGVRGTTITNNELFEKCERAALGAQLNRLEKAPPVQTGVIVFNFKLNQPL